MIDALMVLYLAYDNEGPILPTTLLARAVSVGLYALANRFTLVKDTVILAPIRPLLNAFAFWLSTFPLSDVDVSVGELALAVVKNRLLPRALKHRPIRQLLQAKATSLAFDPITLVSRPIFEYFNAMTLGYPFNPLSFIRAAIRVLAHA